MKIIYAPYLPLKLEDIIERIIHVVSLLKFTITLNQSKKDKKQVKENY